jgi:Tfp pilus assembly protein PilF
MAMSAQDPAQLGKELSVDSVLDGTLQRANGKLRVTLRLIRSSDGVQIWSGSFDESEDEIFKLQDAMARQTASALAREARAGKHSTENRDAYHAYLRGRFFFDKRDSENYAKAIDEFNLAVKFDPNYTLAYAGLADVYAMQANISADDRKRRDELYERSRTMASKALSIDETCAEAHTSLAWIMRVHDWNWEGSEREFKRAIELDPNYANARQWYSFLLLGLGRMDEALVQMEKALELEPLSRIILNNSFSVRNYRDAARDR